MKVIHQGFTQVRNAHTKIDWLIKVKLCLLHVNGNEVFIEDCTTIIVWLAASFWRLSDVINWISTIFLIFSSVYRRQNCSLVLKKSTSKLFPDCLASILSFVFILMYYSSQALSLNLISLWIFVIFLTEAFI